MALLTAAGGMSLAPGPFVLTHALVLLLGTSLIVGAANTLNMYLERDIDRRMARTKDRPLPAERMEPEFALVFGLAQAAIAVPILSFGLGPAGPLTGLLAVIAFVSYVLIYTPMKQRSHLALWVGAVPGAMPALMGWTSVTGSIDAGGVAVFAVLFFWQIPHFDAIALYRLKDYERAGLITVPGARGMAAARIEIVMYALVQLAASLLLYSLGVCGRGYLVVATAAGLGFAALAARGLIRGDARWARSVFLASIVYLPTVYTAMVVDGRL
ncbi:MAG: protoheme IX farnesyltransferase [Myxococcales bacterium]|nr:protoheme IX farnesyltransferase [Myxococcales bacterium]